MMPRHAARTFTRTLCFLLLPLLAACGFQLRGDINLPEAWKDLHLSSPSPNSELSRSLEAGFAANGIRWQDVADANYLLYLGTERFERRNLTIGDNARASEFELIMTTSLKITDKAGNELMPSTDVSVQKVMTSDPENVSGKVEESRLLRNEMRQDLVQQIMRRVRFLATNPT
jgi:LPS-assembly lipoprotein